MPNYTLELKPVWLEHPATVSFYYEAADPGSSTSPSTSEECIIESVEAKGYVKGDPTTELIGVLSDWALDELYGMIEDASDQDEPDHGYQEAA